MLDPNKIRKSITLLNERIKKKKVLIENLESEIKNMEKDIEKLTNHITEEFLNKIQMNPMDILELLEQKDRIRLDHSQIIIQSMDKEEPKEESEKDEFWSADTEEGSEDESKEQDKKNNKEKRETNEK